MNIELITLNEVLNDGSQIFFYQEETTGIWVAWGYSAFLLHRMIGKKCLTNYSELMQMPCTLISSFVFCSIVPNTLEAAANRTRQLQTNLKVDAEEYQKWVEELKKC